MSNWLKQYLQVAFPVPDDYSKELINRMAAILEDGKYWDTHKQTDKGWLKYRDASNNLYWAENFPIKKTGQIKNIIDVWLDPSSTYNSPFFAPFRNGRGPVQGKGKRFHAGFSETDFNYVKANLLIAKETPWDTFLSTHGLTYNEADNPPKI